MTDERDINALRHYVARLEDDLAIAEDAVEHLRRHSSKAEDAVEHLHRHSSKQAADIITLSQEVGRLREALKKIATTQGGGDCCSVYEWFVYAKRIARTALAEQEKM
jgi:cell division septum initiation protein DivIVA